MPEISGRIITVTPTITAGAYTTGQALGGKITFPDACGIGAAAAAYLDSLQLLDLAKQSVAIDLALFAADFTATADGSTFDPSDADAAKFMGYVSITGYSIFNDWSMASRDNIGKMVKPSSGTTMYGQLVIRGSATFASTADITIKAGFARGLAE